MIQTEQATLPEVSHLEYEDRLRRVRAGMAEAGLDALVVSRPENIYYLSGFQTLGYWDPIALIVSHDGPPIHWQLDFETHNVVAMSAWRERPISYAPRDDPAIALAAAVSDVGMAGPKKIGIEKASWFLTVSFFEGLRAALPGPQLLDGSGIVDRARFIKSATELAYMREAGKASSMAMTAAIEAIREGSTENDAAAAAYSAMIGAGGEYPAIPPIIAGGERASLPHGTWSGRTFKRGDIALLEIGASVRRYHAASLRNAVIGEPSRVQKDASAAAFEALEVAIEAIRPGKSFEEVDRLCRSVMVNRGVGRFFLHCTAYPLGIGFPPSWAEQPFNPVMQAGEQRLIEPGMVFHVIPTSNDPGRVGGGHIGASDVVVVTDGGCDTITTVAHTLFVR